jgi:hypothetical protein
MIYFHKRSNDGSDSLLRTPFLKGRVWTIDEVCTLETQQIIDKIEVGYLCRLCLYTVTRSPVLYRLQLPATRLLIYNR